MSRLGQFPKNFVMFSTWFDYRIKLKNDTSSFFFFFSQSKFPPSQAETYTALDFL